jgi:hypothetical protein
MIADGAPAPKDVTAAAEEKKVARRLVLFVHGFDPRGVKMPYSNFLKEFEKHKRLTGAEGTVSAIAPSPPDKPWLKRWRAVLSEPDAAPVETVFDFLEWQDLIPRRRPFRFVRMSFAGITTFFAMLRRGIHFKMGGYARSHGALGVFPFVMLALYLWIMATLVWAGFILARPYGPVATALGTAIGAGLAAAFYVWTVRIDRLLFVWFAIALWNFQWRHGGRGDPAVTARFAAFADHALERLADRSFDEVVVVAVSTAGYYTIEMLGHMLERDPRLAGRKIAFLTFGGQPSITSWFGPRPSFVKAISAVLRSRAIEWIAYTIRGDVMTVAEYDPFRDVGLDPKAFDRGKIIHHRIYIKRMLTPERMRALGWNFLWLHLHYLMASETGEEHDFFAITCTSVPTLSASAAWRALALAARARGADEEVASQVPAEKSTSAIGTGRGTIPRES